MAQVRTPLEILKSVASSGVSDGYYKKLRDPRWETRRKQVIQNAQRTCQSCRCSGVVLQVHHNFYDQSRDPWDYADHELRCLCEKCHQQFHEQLIIFKRDVLPFLDVRSLQVLNGALATGLKFQKPIVIAHAVAAIAANPSKSEALAYSFES